MYANCDELCEEHGYICPHLASCEHGKIGDRCAICERLLRDGDKVIEENGDLYHVDCYINENAFEYYKED